ncbi:MAG: J domain-containing protein [Polyangia bacterium]
MASDPLADLAPRDAVPRFKSSAPLAELGLGPEEGFVLSRVDGNSKLGDLLNLVPFPPERTVEILRRLWIAGAIEITGHTPPVVASKPTLSSTSIPRMATVAAAVPVGVELTLEQLQSIDRFYEAVQSLDAFELLGIARTADKKDVKRAYFKLSKDFHPDRFFGKSLGPYGSRLTQIFQALKSAFELLSDDKRRAAYLDSLGG